METSLALTIIGGVLTLVGIIFNAIPEIVNQKIMGDLGEEARVLEERENPEIAHDRTPEQAEASRSRIALRDAQSTSEIQQG